MSRATTAKTVEVQRGRSPDMIWDYWVMRLNGPSRLHDRVAGKESASKVRSVAGRELLHEIRSLGLAPRFRPSRIRFVGMFLADAGALLRLLQTDLFEEEVLESQPESWVANPWPYEAHSSGARR